MHCIKFAQQKMVVVLVSFGCPFGRGGTLLIDAAGLSLQFGCRGELVVAVISLWRIVWLWKQTFDWNLKP